jgi:hypothetical protein
LHSNVIIVDLEYTVYHAGLRDIFEKKNVVADNAHRGCLKKVTPLGTPQYWEKKI